MSPGLLDKTFFARCAFLKTIQSVFICLFIYLFFACFSFSLRGTLFFLKKGLHCGNGFEIFIFLRLVSKNCCGCMIAVKAGSIFFKKISVFNSENWYYSLSCGKDLS